MSKLFLIFFLGVLISACSKTPYYEKTFSFENKTWKDDVKPKFFIDIKNIENPYNFTLTIRTTTDYNYSCIWLFMKSVMPDGSIKREPFKVQITNEDGSWIGNKTGSIIETELSFQPQLLPQKGKYAFTIELGITESKINEVLDLGLRVEEIKK